MTFLPTSWEIQIEFPIVGFNHYRYLRIELTDESLSPCSFTTQTNNKIFGKTCLNTSDFPSSSDLGLHKTSRKIGCCYECIVVFFFLLKFIFPFHLERFKLFILILISLVTSGTDGKFHEKSYDANSIKFLITARILFGWVHRFWLRNLLYRERLFDWFCNQWWNEKRWGGDGD